MDAIRFLEEIGRDQVSQADYAAAVAGLDIAEEQRQALLEGNHGALAELLKARSKMFFGVFAPDEEPLEDEPAEDRPEEPGETER